MSEPEHITSIKICGIREWSTIQYMLDHDIMARYVGFVMVKASPRYIPPDQAATLYQELFDSGFMQWVEPVLLFQNHSLKEVLAISETCFTDSWGGTIQLHGDEDEAFIDAIPEELRVIKAIDFDLDNIERWRSNSRLTNLLIDTPAPQGKPSGGTGKTFDWDIFSSVDKTDLPPIMLAGGLTPANVGQAIRTVRPYAVDVSSGVESSRGVKDHGLIREFCAAVREADASLAMD